MKVKICLYKNKPKSDIRRDLHKSNTLGKVRIDADGSQVQQRIRCLL